MNVLIALIALIGLAFAILLLYICKKSIIPRCCKPCQKVYYMIETRLFFNSILRAALQTFFGIAVSTCFAYTVINDDGETSLPVQISLSVAMTLYILSAPILSFFGMRKAGDRLQDPTFRQRFDSLYAGVDYFKKSSAIMYTSQFFARRIVYAMALCFVTSSVVL